MISHLAHDIQKIIANFGIIAANFGIIYSNYLSSITMHIGHYNAAHIFSVNIMIIV